MVRDQWNVFSKQSFNSLEFRIYIKSYPVNLLNPSYACVQYSEVTYGIMNT